VGQRAVAGPRDILLLLESGDTEARLVDAISIVVGEIEVFSLDPDQIERGDSQTVTFQGLNLDAVVSVALGEGIEVTALEAASGDPTRATAEVTVADTAVGGFYDVELVDGDGLGDSLENGLEVVPGLIDVDAIEPSEVTRGETLDLTITGLNLDVVTAVLLGNGVRVESLSLVDATELTVTSTILDEALPVGSARTVTFVGPDDRLEVEEVFIVNAGALELTGLRPDIVTQGARLEVTVDGLNLDGLTQLDAGDDVVVTRIDSLSPVEAVISLEIDDEATVGVQDVTVEGDFGEDTRAEGLQILERVQPPVQITFPGVVDVGSVELGSRKRFSMVFRNQIEETEIVELEIASGDVNEFRFVDDTGETLDELYPSSLGFTLDPLREVIITGEYRASLRAGSQVDIEVTVRGELFGEMEIRGTGVPPTVLSFIPVSPVSIPSVEAGQVGFKQVSTISESADRTQIVSISILVERDNTPFPEGAALTTITLSDPLPPETETLFGSTLITLETDYPAGTYEGEVAVITDRAAAPIMAFVFNTIVTPRPEPDPTPDVGGDGPPDAGESDAGGRDAGRADDAGLADSGGSDGALADGGEAGDGPPGDDGCCAQVNGRRSPHTLVWILLFCGLALRVRPDPRRRRS
jgi:hypothetical protein